MDNKYTLEFLAEEVQKKDDVQIYYEDGEWIVRWGPPSYDELEWGAVVKASNLRDTLESAYHGMYKS